MNRSLVSQPLLLLLALLYALCMVPANAATLYWGSSQSGVYNPTYCCTLADGTPIATAGGGLNLTAGQIVTNAAQADMVINVYGALGAAGVAQLNESFAETSTPDPGRYSNTVNITAGGVYLIVTHDGKHAKLRIDTLTRNTVYFSYMLEQSAPVSNVTYFIDCARQTLPGGVSCSAPVSLGNLYSANDLSSAAATLRCQNVGYGIFYCDNTTAIAGVLITYTYTGTTTVSRIVYMH